MNIKLRHFVQKTLTEHTGWRNAVREWVSDGSLPVCHKHGTAHAVLIKQKIILIKITAVGCRSIEWSDPCCWVKSSDSNPTMTHTALVANQLEAVHPSLYCAKSFWSSLRPGSLCSIRTKLSQLGGGGGSRTFPGMCPHSCSQALLSSALPLRLCRASTWSALRSPCPFSTARSFTTSKLFTLHSPPSTINLHFCLHGSIHLTSAPSFYSFILSHSSSLARPHAMWHGHGAVVRMDKLLNLLTAHSECSLGVF